MAWQEAEDSQLMDYFEQLTNNIHEDINAANDLQAATNGFNVQLMKQMSTQ